MNYLIRMLLMSSDKRSFTLKKNAGQEVVYEGKELEQLEGGHP